MAEVCFSPKQKSGAVWHHLSPTGEACRCGGAVGEVRSAVATTRVCQKCSSWASSNAPGRRCSSQIAVRR